MTSAQARPRPCELTCADGLTHHTTTAQKDARAVIAHRMIDFFSECTYREYCELTWSVESNAIILPSQRTTLQFLFAQVVVHLLEHGSRRRCTSGFKTQRMSGNAHSAQSAGSLTFTCAGCEDTRHAGN